MKVKSLSRVRLLATPWTAAYQAPPPMGFSKQEYWSGVPLPSPVLSLDGRKVYHHLLKPIFHTQVDAVADRWLSSPQAFSLPPCYQ